jgi:hypothetical protein
MSEEDYISRCKFISGLMIGSGYECKCYTRDFIPFIQEFNPKWNKLYDRYINSNCTEWAVFGEVNNIVVFYDHKSDECIHEKMSDWSF